MLIKCPECLLQISDKAIYCPHCGYPMKENIKPKKIRVSNKRRRLPNGFGQISEIKNRNLRNPFRAMVTVGKTPEGRPICKPLKPDSYFLTYNDAYSALLEYNKNPYDLNPSITIKELYEKWTEEHFKTLKTKSGIRAITGAWTYCSTVYSMRVTDLRARHIKGCMDESNTAAMKNKIKSLFNMMLDYALEYEIVDRNYSRSFKLSEDIIKEYGVVKKGHLAFTDDEIELLWDNVENKKYVDILLIQCYSGWRPQELGLIEVANINFENWTFQGGMKTEAGKDRIVPIHSKIRPLVSKRYDEALKLGSKYLFNYVEEGFKDTLLTYNRYSGGFSMIRDELNLNPNHRPHDGRTHFVTMAKKYNIDEYAIKYIVGHKISDITEKVYTKREFDWLQTEIEKIK
ncbi:MAG: tyrosine-type recombinase/integrase [Oscillospiraceae bacterium]|jgi:integrase|nr:tyrosine-type recombinase/integrase [Oscillospiraceae bacterium]